MTPPLTYSTIAAIDVANSGRMRAGLAALERRNLGAKRGRAARQHKARVAAELRRTNPGIVGEPVRRADVPVTFKAEPKRRRATRPATSTAPEPVKAAPAYRPIKAADLPSEIKAVTRRHLADGDLSADWFCVGILDRDDLTVNVYARKHGASVRYSTGA
ncbi:hypothetical protein AB0F77_06135 [Streptomyces sp. NPDC026672]|uniref:hypothetical protein n=1 Tax=unclassified Streptomyces TaxID=2593676 RepID=UPI0033DBE55F